MKNHRILPLVLSLMLCINISACSKSGKPIENNPPAAQKTAEEKSSKPAGSADAAPAPDAGSQTNNSPQTQNTAAQPTTQQPEPSPKPLSPAELATVKPNEAGKIMVVMFHNFIDTYTKGDKQYTTTFSEFAKLLQSLYDSGYRLISLSDFYNNNISVPAGFIPMVFTFDDGTAGQFNLVEENGRLAANRQSAVGIMEEFNSRHPDFGLKGTFYVNLGNSTFGDKGNIQERLKYLIDKGFEIGNHTYTHVMLNKVTSAEVVQQEVGRNNNTMQKLVPGYIMNSLSLPYGLPAKELQKYVSSGEFEGQKYQNLTVMEVGWDPSVSPASTKFNPLSVHRVRASGIEPVEADLGWWLKKLSRSEQYVSDGDPATVTVPQAKRGEIDDAKLKGKSIVAY